jgi:DNA repair protein RecO (recombination protein O)
LAASELQIEALVLRRVEYGDADLILSLYTRERGRFSAIARNARKSQRRFSGALEPGNVAVVRFRPKTSGSMETLAQSTLIEAHLGILTSLARIEQLGRVTRLLERLTPERSPEPLIFERATELLARLDHGVAGEADVLAFHLGLLDCLGHAPTLDRCVQCGEEAPEERPAYFDPARGGIASRRCGGGSMILSAAARRAMRAALAEGEAEHPWPPDICAEVGRALEAFTRHHIR